MLDGLLAASPQPGSASRPEVAVPKKWTVPSGKVWGTSKLQVTRSPCALCLDLAVVSLWVGPPGGVNCRWPESQQAAAFVVAQGLDVHPARWASARSAILGRSLAGSGHRTASGSTSPARSSRNLVVSKCSP